MGAKNEKGSENVAPPAPAIKKGSETVRKKKQIKRTLEKIKEPYPRHEKKMKYSSNCFIYRAPISSFPFASASYPGSRRMRLPPSY